MRRQVKLVTPHQEADAVLFIFLSGFRNRYSGKKIDVFEKNPLLLAPETKRKSYNKTEKKMHGTMGRQNGYGGFAPPDSSHIFSERINMQILNETIIDGSCTIVLGSVLL